MILFKRGAKRREILERDLAEFSRRVEERGRLLRLLKDRLERRDTPDETRERHGFTIEIYNLPEGGSAARIRDWELLMREALDPLALDAGNLVHAARAWKCPDIEKSIESIEEKKRSLDSLAEEIGFSEFYFDIGEAEDNIDLATTGLKKTKEELQAAREVALRRQENVRFLASDYRRRKKASPLKAGLAAVDELGQLTPVEFEKWVKGHVFEKEGWKVSETRRTGDGGIDLVLWRGKEMSIAQCKRYKGTVGEPLLRDFYGAMMSEGVSQGYFVTTGLFSLSALKFAEDKPIELIDRRVLAQKYVK